MNRSSKSSTHRPRSTRPGFHRTRLRLSLHGTVLLTAAYLLSSPAAVFGVANTEIDVKNGSTDLSAAASYTPATTPSVSTDVTFLSTPAYTTTAFTVGNTSLTFGSLDDLSATALTISNSNGTAAQTITLGGSGDNGDSVTGSNSADLLYVATGGNLTLTGGTTTTALGLVLGQSGNFDIAGAATIGSIISGAQSITKTGTGTLALTGVNTYSGGTTLSAGIFRVGVSSTFAGGAVTGGALGTGSVTIGSGVTLGGQFVLGASSFIVNGDFNVGYTGQIGRLSLGGPINLNGTAPSNGSAGTTRTVTLFASTAASAFTAGTSGNNQLNLSTQANGPTVSVANGTLKLVADPTVPAGNLSVVELATNSFTGGAGLTIGNKVITVITSGTPFAAGGSVDPRLTINAGGYFNASSTTSARIINVFSLQGDGVFTNLSNSATAANAPLTIDGSDTATFSGTIADGAAYKTTFSGLNATAAINGTVSVVKAGTGTQTFSGANTYSGGTTVNVGTLVGTNTAAFGSGGITFGSATSGTLSLLNDGGTGTVNGQTITYGNNVTSTSATAPTINVGNNGNAGSTGNTIVLGSLTTNSTPTNTFTNANGYNLTFSGGATSTGAAKFANNMVNGTLTLASFTDSAASSQTVTFGGTSASATTSVGTISQNGANALTITQNGSGVLQLTGQNTYTGSTIVNAGTVIATASSTPTSGTVTSGPLGIGNINPSATGSTDAVVALGAPGSSGGLAVGNSTTITGNTGASGNAVLAGLNSSGTNTFNGNVQIGTSNNTQVNLTVVAASGGTTTFAGTLSNGGTGANGVIVGSETIAGTTYGGGTVVFSKSTGNTYTGGTTINAGTLLVNNTSNSGTGGGAVMVNNGGTLGGTGIVTGSVTVAGSGKINPGPSGTAGTAAATGMLNIGALTLSSTTSALSFDLNATSAYDKLASAGLVSLNGGTLNVTVGSGVFSTGDVLTLITTPSGDLSGTFNGIAEGAVVANNGSYSFTADYTSTGFNLDVTAVPEPSTWVGAAMAVGLGGLIKFRRRLQGA